MALVDTGSSDCELSALEADGLDALCGLFWRLFDVLVIPLRP